MTGIRVSIVIDASPAQVWRVVEHVDDHVEWMHDAVAIRFQTNNHRGVGTSFLCDTKVGPIKLVDKMEISEWAPGAAMGVHHVGLITGTGRFTLTPIDLGRRTRFGWDEWLTFPWWLGGRVGALVAGRLVLRPIWTRNLRSLKAIVEAGVEQ